MEKFDWCMDFIRNPNEPCKVNMEHMCYKCGKPAVYRIQMDYRYEDSETPYLTVDNYICEECKQNLMNELESTDFNKDK